MTLAHEQKHSRSVAITTYDYISKNSMAEKALSASTVLGLTIVRALNSFSRSGESGAG